MAEQPTYGLTKGDHRKVAQTIRTVNAGTGSRRPVPTRRRVQTSRPGKKKPDELRGQVQTYTAAGDSGNTYGIITLKVSSPAPIALPTGTPAISGTILVADVHLLGASYFTAGLIVRAIHNVGIDTITVEMEELQVDWEHISTSGAPPAQIIQVYHPTLADGKAVDPVHEELDHIFKGSLGGTDNIWIESVDGIADDEVRSCLPADGYFIGFYAGLYTPSEAIDPEFEEDVSDEERPLYRIQRPNPGVVLGIITDDNGSLSEGDWSDTAIPVPGEVVVSIYRHEEDASLSVWKTGVLALYAPEVQATAGKVVYLSRMEGYWHVTSQMCAVASGYSEE